MSYDLLRVLHIISVISWMAGLLYLPRLYVYHAQAVKGGDASETFKIMERRLLRYIMNPAMVATWVFGLWLMMAGDWMQQGWAHTKLLLVVLMTGAHHAMSADRKRFAADANTKSVRYYKILNEVPTVLMIGIVFLVILKPF